MCVKSEFSFKNGNFVSYVLACNCKFVLFVEMFMCDEVVVVELSENQNLCLFLTRDMKVMGCCCIHP